MAKRKVKIEVGSGCIEGLRCPKCGYHESFKIAFSAIGTFVESGLDEDGGDTEWDDGSYCGCPECEYDGIVQDFRAKDTKTADSSRKHECANCGEFWHDSKLKPVEDLTQRVEPGETMPSGECPACGALCFPKVPQTIFDLIRNLTAKERAALIKRHPCKDWQYEVANGDTELGWEEWLGHQFEADQA